MGSRVLVSRDDSFSSFINRNSVRLYATNVAPDLVLNTFPAGFTTTLRAPEWRFQSKGTAVESGHSSQYAFERTFPGPYGMQTPNATSQLLTSPFEVRGHIATNTATPANVSTADAFGGVTIFEPGVSVANYATSGQSFVQLRQSLTTRTSWTFLVYDGAGTFYTYAMTVPEPGGAAAGHTFKIRVDVPANYFSATVDNAVTAVATSLPAGSMTNVAVGSIISSVLYAGTTQTAATQSTISLGGLSMISYNTGG